MGSSSETVQKKNEPKTTAIDVLKNQFSDQELEGVQEASQTDATGVKDLEKNYNSRDFSAFDYLTGLFKSSIDFKVKGVEVKGKDKENISVAPIPLFKGSVLDLSSTEVKGNARGKQRWIEGYGGTLLLRPQGSITIKKVKLLSFWMGVSDVNQKNATIILQTDGGTIFDYKKKHYKVDMFWMNGITIDKTPQKDGTVKPEAKNADPNSKEQNQLHMAGAREVNENGQEVKGTASGPGIMDEFGAYMTEGTEHGKIIDFLTASNEEEQSDAQTSTMLGVAADVGLTAVKEAFNIKERTEQFKKALQAIKDPKNAGSLLDSGEDDMSLTLAEVPILPPFVWAEVTLEAELDAKPKLDFDTKEIIDIYVDRATELWKKISTQKELASKIEKERNPDKQIELVKKELLGENIKIPINLSAAIILDASIGIRLGVGAGIPNLLTISAGVFGNIGVHGTNEDDSCLKGSASAELNYFFAPETISLSQMKAEVAGGFKFSAQAGIDVTLESAIFHWQKSLFELQKEANLASFNFNAVLLNDRTISSNQGFMSALRDFLDGWHLDSADLSVGGLLADFLAKNPKEKSFNLISSSALSAPLKEADDVIAEIDMLLEEVASNEISEKQITKIGIAIKSIEESKKNLEELQKKINDNKSCQDNLTRLKELVNHHEDNKKLLEDIRNGNTSSDEYEMNDIDSADFQKFQKRQSEEQAKREIATYDNIRAYEEERKNHYGKKHSKRIQLLEEKLKELKITEAHMNEKNVDFAAFYKTLSSSEFTKNIALESDLDELRKYEQKRAYEYRKLFKTRIDTLLEKMENFGIKKEDLPKVHYAIGNMDWSVDKWIAKGEKNKYQAIWKYYKENMEGKAFISDMEQFLNREDLKDMLFADLNEDKKEKDEKKRNNKWQFKTSESSIHKYNHLTMAVLLSSYIQNYDEISYKKIYDSYYKAGLFDYYSKDPDFWLVKMGKEAMNAYENAAVLEYLLKSDKKEKDQKSNFEIAMGENLEASVNLILAYEISTRKKSENPTKKSDHEVIFSSCRKKLDKVNKEHIKLGKEERENIRSNVNAYMADPNHGSKLIKYLKEGKGDTLDAKGDFIKELNQRLMVLMPSAKGKNKKHIEKHNNRLNRIKNSRGNSTENDEDDVFDIWMDYRNEDQNVELYYEKVKERAEAEGNSKPTGHELNLKQWYAYEKLKLEKNKEKEWGKLPQGISQIKLFEILYEGEDDEATVRAYHELTGGKSVTKRNEEELEKYIQPNMILEFECAQANRAAQKHIHRLKIIDQGGTFDEVVTRYRDQVEKDHKMNKFKAFFKMHVSGGFEKFLKKAGRKFDPTPKQIMEYEIGRNETLTRKHSLRLKKLEGSEGVALYMQEAGKGFWESKKDEIKKRAEKLRTKQPATNEQKLQFHEEQLKHYQAMYKDISEPITELKEKIAALDEKFKKLQAEYEERL